MNSKKRNADRQPAADSVAAHGVAAHGEAAGGSAPDARRRNDPPAGRPRTARLPRPRAERAVQFMPFAALTGYYDLVHEVDEQTAAEGDK